MNKHKFGSSEFMVPVIGQGSWNFPERKSSAVEETKQALRIGVEKGMVHIDTAEMYGQSEDIIGDAIKDFERDDLFIVSKVSPSSASFDGTIKACERSLQRLGVSYLDCYLLHWRGNIPLSETMEAMEKLVDDGKIRSLGVSNFDVSDLTEAIGLLSRHRIACNQVLYNLYERGIERNLLEFCRTNDIAVVGYTPFAQKSTPGPDTTGGAALREVAKAHGASCEQITLAFLVRMDNLFAIPKATKIEHAVQNAGAGDIVLSEQQINLIDQAFPAPITDTPLAVL